MTTPLFQVAATRLAMPADGSEGRLHKTVVDSARPSPSTVILLGARWDIGPDMEGISFIISQAISLAHPFAAFVPAFVPACNLVRTKAGPGIPFAHTRPAGPDSSESRLDQNSPVMRPRLPPN
jgi:hypothetical protein